MSKWRPVGNGEAIYVFGDIHSRYAELSLFLDRILPLRPPNGDYFDRCVFLGDYIDRGRETYKTIETLISLKQKYGKQIILLRGNHEQLLLNSLGLGKNGTAFSFETISDYAIWIENGGCESIIDWAKHKGVEIKNPKELPSHRCLSFINKDHIKFLQEETQLYYEYKDYLFAHAGIEPNIPMNEQDEDVLLWDRSLYSTVKSIILQGKNLPWDKTVVVGHNYDGLFFNEKFIMLDASAKDALLCLELSSLECFAAYSGNNRLVKYKF